MSKARTLALPYAIGRLLRQRSPHPIDAPGLIKIAQARGTRLTIDEVVAALGKLVDDAKVERLEGDQFRWARGNDEGPLPAAN